MTNAEMITALRCCASLDTPCKGLCPYYGVEYCQTKKDLDAADAIEHLNHLVDLNTQRCEALRKQLRESHESYERHIAEQQEQIAKLYILLNNRINEIAELEAQLPKEGEWIDIDGTMFAECSVCGKRHYGCTTPYCDMCGARMRGANDE